MKTLTATSSGERLVDWLDRRLDDVKESLNEAGGVLLRGFDTDSASTLRDVLAAFGHEPMEDARWSSPRHSVGDGAFTSTDYPPDQTIVLHSEMTYARLWPRLLLFQCRIAAETGGATTVCDLAEFSRALGGLAEEFHEREVLYIRNFRPGIDIRWQDAFGTEEESEVERIGAEHGLEVEWKEKGVLRTYQQAQGAVTGANGPQYFNQAHLYHPTQLPTDTRRALMSAFGEEGMPRNAVFGDGAPIPDGVISQILELLTKHTRNIDWRDGDVAIIDNMRWMHGRAPFTGKRKVHVAMGRPQTEPATTTLF